MVKKKRKAKQKRSTDAHETVTGPVSVEESPLYIDIATPGTPVASDRYRPVPRQDVQDLGTAQPDSGMISGSIIGLTSGEIRIDHDAALFVHFEGERSRKRPSILVAEEDAVVEEPDFYGRHKGDSDPEGPTPAPHLHASQQAKKPPVEEPEEAPIEDLGPSLPPENEPQPSGAKAVAEAPGGVEQPGERPRRRRNTLPQHQRPSESKAAVPHHPMEPIVSGEFTVVSGEIMLVPEEDIPAKSPGETRPEPPARRQPVAPPPLPKAALPPPPPPPEPAEAIEGGVEPSTPDEEPSPEEVAARNQARTARREMLRQMIAQAPVPFAMNIPDKSARASDAGFIPAAPVAPQPLQPTRPMVEPAGEITTPAAAPPPPLPPEPAAVASVPVPKHGRSTGTMETKPGRHARHAQAPASEKTEAPAAPAAAAPAAAVAPTSENTRPHRGATPLENTLVSNNLEQMAGQNLSGRLPRAATRDDLPTKFSDLEEEFFEKELHPENDYSGLDEVFAQMQEQNPPNGSILNSLKRLFVADVPPPKNGGTKNGSAGKATPAPKPAAKKPKGGHAPKKK